MIQIQSEDYLREIAIVFFANFKLIVAVTLACTAIATIIAFHAPPKYKVITSFFITGNRLEKNPETLEETELKVGALTREDLLSEMEMLRSYDVIENTVKKIIQKKPDFFEDDGGALNITKKTREIQADVVTEILPKTNIIQMELTTGDPKVGMIITEGISDEFIKFRSTIFNPVQAESFFEQQTSQYSRELLDKEDELIRIVELYKSAVPAQEIESNLLIINSIKDQLTLKRSEAIETRQYIDHLQKLLASEKQHHFSFIEELSITNFSEKLQLLVIEKGNLLRTFSPESVRVMRIEEQVQNTFLQLKSEVKIYVSDKVRQLNTLQATIAEYENRIDILSKRNVTLHTQLILMNRIDNEISSLRRSHDIFSKRWEESKINKKWKMGNLFSVRVLRKPFCSGVPVFPNKRNLILIGIVAGFMIGCSVSFILEFFDHTFKKPEDVNKYAGLPTIFSIPQWKENS